MNGDLVAWESIAHVLVIDVGNTNTVLGVFEGVIWSLIGDIAKQSQTADEYGILARNLFNLANIEVSKIGHIIIASVVPPLNSVLEDILRSNPFL